MIESRLEREFRERLDAGKLTPPGVKGRILPTPPVENRPYREIDAIVEFTFEHVPNRVINAVVEMKSRLTPMMLEGAIHQVMSYRNELRRAGIFEDVYPMLAAPYISESVQRRCKEVQVGYIDLNGTISIIHKDIYIDVVRPAVEFKNPQGIRNIFSARSRRLLRVLLANPFTPFRLEDLASKADVSVGQVFQVTKRLQEQGYLERSSEGRRLIRPRKLLRHLAQELKADYAHKRLVIQAFSESPTHSVADSIAEFCTRRLIPFAFTLGSGLEPSERNVRQDVTAVYVAAAAEILKGEVRLESVSRGANVLIMTAPEEDNTDKGGVFYQTRTLSTGLVGVNPVQLFIDFTLQGGRGEEQADFLLEHSLGFHE